VFIAEHDAVESPTEYPAEFPTTEMAVPERVKVMDTILTS
jgi:hypothetical protein